MRRVVGPFNRVEGDLEVTLESSDGVIEAAHVNSPLYRGFEQMLHGKEPHDALVITPRICGICSVSQSMAAAAALRDISGVEQPPNGRLSMNLVHAAENVADHLSHFYLFFMPDFARAGYAERHWHGEIAAQFRAGDGEAAAAFLPARAQFMHMLGYLAGKWPHTLSTQPGGTTRTIGASEKMRVRALLHEFRRYLERCVFGGELESLAELDSAQSLDKWLSNRTGESSDFARFLHVANDLQLDQLGRPNTAFMSYGCYEEEKGTLFARGVWDEKEEPLNSGNIAEDITHSWLAGDNEPRHPGKGATLPVAEKEGAYSWCKAPRLAGRVVETGALARQVVDGHPLARDLVSQSGGNVRNRVVARLLEVTRLVPVMEGWIDAIQPREPFCVRSPLPESDQGAGLVEAACGSLGHWVSVEQGGIANYQIIAPTTWNFSPRDGRGIPGALEQALVGTTVEDSEDTPVNVQHIVRSFDPCMVCTVH